MNSKNNSISSKIKADILVDLCLFAFNNGFHDVKTQMITLIMQFCSTFST